MASTFSPQAGYMPQGFQGAYNAGVAYNAPEFQQLQGQRSSLMRQLGYGEGMYGVDQQMLQNQYQGNLADIAAQRGGNAIDLAAAQRLLPYYDQLLGLSDQMLSSQMRGYDVQEDQSRLGARSDTFHLMEDATARGALATPGVRTERGFIDENLLNSLRGIMEQKNQATIGNTKEKLGLYEQKAQANDRIARIGIEEQALGMKEGTLKRTLELGLQKLGYQHLMGVNDIFDALNSNNYQQSLLARQIMNDAVAYGQQNQIGSGGGVQRTPGTPKLSVYRNASQQPGGYSPPRVRSGPA